jgi:protein SHQ1
MPITPHFHLSQSLTHVVVEIRVPHIRVSVDTVEILVEDDTLHFSSPPYLLVLKFPADFANLESNETAKFDPSREGGMIILELTKLEPDLWPNLDLLAKLLRPKETFSGKFRSPIISQAQVISEEIFAESNDNDINEDERKESVSACINNSNKVQYGFLNQFSGIFTDLVRDGLAIEMLQLPNPDETPASERRILRLAAEDKSFNVERYLGDLFIDDDYVYQCAMAMKPHWTRSIEDQHDSPEILNTTQYFTESERLLLSSIAYPILPSIIDDTQQRALLMGLMDLLFAYVYDHLTTDGDPSIESSWTISNLSFTLSWLETPSDSDQLFDIVRFTVRRSLIYPYIRNFEFSNYCWDQVAIILKNGQRCILRCLLQIRSILQASEFHYLNNKLYLDHYLAWIQRTVDDTTLLHFSKEVMAMKRNEYWIHKSQIGWNLLAIEQESEDENENDECSSSNSDKTTNMSEHTEGDNDKIVDSNLNFSSESPSPISFPERRKDSNILHDSNKLVSSSLVDSSLGSLAMLRISDLEEEEEENVSQPESKATKISPLIQELE